MTIDKLFFICFSFLVITLLTSSQATPNVFGALPSPEFKNSNECWTNPTPGKPGDYQTTCCWTVVDAEGIELDYCQTCDYYPGLGHVNCGNSYPADMVSPGSGRLPPGGLDDNPTLEQPPTENEPPIKSGDSVFPNDDGVAEDQQSEQPSIKLNQGIILEERTIEADPQQNPSFTEQEKTSLEFSESENSSSSETSDSEQTTSFAKKGNGQNSPVPPECPKQGPIPPNCTMKPKF